MLDKLGELVEKRPWLVVGIILMITIGFGTLLPFLEMGTSMEDFTPDDEIVKANLRVNEYFGGTDEMLMIYVEKQKADTVVTPEALKEEYIVSKELEKFDETKESISVASFVDIICQMEFGKTLLDCSNEEITTAFQDLMTEQNGDKIKIMNADDSNEKVDYNPYPRISKGKTIDSIDIKNYYIEENDDKIYFSIEVYDLSHFKSKLIPPYSKMNVMEWYIDFKNLIIPDERLDIDFKIAAHVEPTNQLWEIGKGPIKNLRDIFYNIRNRELFGSYKKEAYLWIKPPGQEFSFPIKLETGNVSFNVAENIIEIEVERKELGKYGIAPEMYGVGLPARLGDSKAGFRFYQIPGLKLPWLRVTTSIGFIQNFAEKIQNRPVLSAISTKMLSKIGDFSWEDFDMLFAMLDEGELSIDKISLKDMSAWWVVTDEAPDTDFADNTFFIKPFFMDELKNVAIIFLSEDYKRGSGPSATLIMIPINETVGPMHAGDVSKKVVQAMEKYDSERDYVTMKATGNGVISYQIDEVTTEANKIIAPGIFIAICVILFLSFRRLSYVFLPMMGLSISLVWVFGTMVLLGMRFNAMSVAIVPLLMGLGVDYSVHVFHNYRAELGKGKTPGKAIAAAIKDIGTAMSLAVITTVIAFLSFLTASVPPIRDFGILCAIGIVYTFIMTITLQASVRHILDRRKKAAGKLRSKSNSNGKTMRKTSKIVYKHPGTILIIASIVTIIMIGGAINVQTGFDMEDFLPENNPALTIMMDISEDFPFSSQDQEYILIEGSVASVDTLRGISKTYDNLKDDKFIAKTPEGDLKVTSILSIIKDAVRENNTIASEFNIDQNGIPRNNQDVKRVYDYLFESNVYGLAARTVLHRDGNSYDATVIRTYLDFSAWEDDDSEDINTVMGIIYDDLNGDIASYGNTNAIVTGMSSSMYTITNSLTESQIISTAISIILAALVLIIAYRNPLLGLIAIMPVVISILWILGTMYFIGYSLNIMTIMVTCLTIGIGIDYAIHATERFRKVADKTGDVLEAVSETVGHTGGALLIAAMTTIAGFGMLIFAPIPPEQQFGVIMCLTILYAFLTSIFILPPIVMSWGKWRKKRKGYIISPKKYKRDENDVLLSRERKE